MKSLFSTVLKFSAISTFVLCGFVACSDDASSTGNDNNHQGSDNITKPPQTTDEHPITIGKYTAEISPDGSYFIVSGSANINVMDTVAIPAGEEAYFTDFQFTLAKIENGVPVKTQAQIFCNGQPCALQSYTQVVNLTQLSTTISNFGENDCGTFRIYSTYYASYDLNNPSMYIMTDSSDITRPQSYCETQSAQPVTPAPTPGENIILTSYTVNVNTKMGDGLSLATGTVVPQAQADIYFTSDDLTDEIKIHSGNGFQFTEYINGDDTDYSDDWNITFLPSDPVTMNLFRFRTNKLETVSDFMNLTFYIALGTNYNADTGDGFYAITEADQSIADANHNLVITLLVYKK